MMTEKQIDHARMTALASEELDDSPWEHTVDGEPRRFAYSYDGVPEWVARDLGVVGGDMDDLGRSYRTALVEELFGVAATPDGWERVAAFGATPEAGCECGGDADCPVCEGDGLIYVGEGWREVVYRERFEARVECEEAVEVQLCTDWSDDYADVIVIECVRVGGLVVGVRRVFRDDEPDDALPRYRREMLLAEYTPERLTAIIAQWEADHAEPPDAADQAEKARGY